MVGVWRRALVLRILPGFCGHCGLDAINCLWLCPTLRSTMSPMLRLPHPASAIDGLALSLATQDVIVRRVLAIHLVRSAHNMVRSHNHQPSRLQLWRLFLARFRKLARDSPKERAFLLAVAPSSSPPAVLA